MYAVICCCKENDMLWTLRNTCKAAVELWKSFSARCRNCSLGRVSVLLSFARIYLDMWITVWKISYLYACKYHNNMRSLYRKILVNKTSCYLYQMFITTFFEFWYTVYIANRNKHHSWITFRSSKYLCWSSVD